MRVVGDDASTSSTANLRHATTRRHRSNTAFAPDEQPRTSARCSCAFGTHFLPMYATPHSINMAQIGHSICTVRVGRRWSLNGWRAFSCHTCGVYSLNPRRISVLALQRLVEGPVPAVSAPATCRFHRMNPTPCLESRLCPGTTVYLPPGLIQRCSSLLSSPLVATPTQSRGVETTRISPLITRNSLKPAAWVSYPFPAWIRFSPRWTKLN